MTDPLTGVRVIDLSRLLPGPFASLLLTEMGADVVKVEDPSGGDPMRVMAPIVDGESALFVALNRGKRSLALNLKAPAGRSAFLRLVAHADVVLESFRPGIVERLGIDYEVARAANPRLIYCSLSGYGQTGPLRERAGHDVNYLALSGVLGLTGQNETSPVIPAVQVADLSGGMFAALAILGALRARDQSGHGQYLDLALFDASLAWLLVPMIQFTASGILPIRGRQHLTGAYPCYNIYETADGGFMSLGALEPAFWIRFCEAAGRPDLVAHQFDPSIAGDVQSIFARRTRQEWVDLLAGVDCCCEAVLSLDESRSHPQARQRAVWVSSDGPVPILRSPLGRVRPAGPPDPPPALGQHSTEVLAEAGLAPAEIEAVLRENPSAL